MADCRNARVRLRRRLEKKYPLKRVSVKSKKLGDKIVPRIVVTLDLNNRKDDFIDDSFKKYKESEKDFLVKVDYFEDDYCNYTITFLVDSIDIGVNKIKMLAISELLDNVIPELERIYEEVVSFETN